MKRGTAIAAVVTTVVLALPGLAEARPWGGSGANDLGSAYALFQASNGQVRLTNAQMILSCRDTGNGTYSDRAFTAHFPNRVTLRRNRFSFHFAALSGGRLGDVRMQGILGSNGRGAVRLEIDAVGNDLDGHVVERCQGAVRITLRRGPGR